MSELTTEEKRELKNAKERENWRRRRMKVLESLGLDPDRPVRADGKRGLLIYPSERSLPDEFRFPKDGETQEVFEKRRRKEIARRYNEKHRERLAIERRAYYIENREHITEVKRKYHASHPDIRKKIQKKYLENNPDRLDELKQWRKKNPKKVAENKDKWYKENQALRNSYSSQRRAAERKQSPIWANNKVIVSVFEACNVITQQTGILHHVDHIVPLRGKRMSGLHIPSNLRIITGEENVKKRASLDEDYVVSLMKRDWESND